MKLKPLLYVDGETFVDGDDLSKVTVEAKVSHMNAGRSCGSSSSSPSVVTSAAMATAKS